MNGETVMGHYMPPDGWMADLGYESAYVLVSHQFDFGLMAARLDWFAVNDRNYEFIDDNNEEGWAATVAWQKPLNKWARLAAELLDVTGQRGHPLLGVLDGAVGVAVAGEVTEVKCFRGGSGPECVATAIAPWNF